MGTSVDPAYIDRLRNDIKIACQRLEEHGHESLVITVSGNSHIVTGSLRGTEFVQDRYVFVTDFVNYCVTKRAKVKLENEDIVTELVPVGKNPPVRATKTSANTSERFVCESLNTQIPDCRVDSNLFDGDIDGYEKMGMSESDNQLLGDINDGKGENASDVHENLGVLKPQEEEINNVKTEPATVKGRNMKKRKAKCPDVVNKKLATAKEVSNRLDKKITVKADFDKIKPKRAKAEAVKSVSDKIKGRSVKVKGVKAESHKIDSCSEKAKKAKAESDKLEGHSEKAKGGRQKPYKKKTQPTEVKMVKSECDTTKTKSVKIKAFNVKPDKSKAKLEDNKAVTVVRPEVKQKVPEEPLEEIPVFAIKTSAGHLKCNVCNQFLSSEDQVVEHAKAHKALTCEWCGKMCRSWQFLQKHKVNHCEKHLCNISCELCSEKFVSKLHLKIHNEQVHENFLEKTKGKFPCDKCKSIFKFKQHLTEHNQRRPDCAQENKDRKLNDKSKDHLGEVVKYKDPVTDETWETTLGELLDKAKEGKNTCKLCQKSYGSKTGYKRHVYTHATLKLLFCNICNTNFTNMENLKKHMKRHDERPFFCTTCFMRFETKAKLDYHSNGSCKPNSNTNNLICKDCGYQAMNMSSYKQHLKHKHGGYLEVCDLCGDTFTQQIQLKRHKQVAHSLGEKYECSSCDKVFTMRYNWKRHMRIHGDRKFKCEVCEYQTAIARNLKIHMRTHTQERPYVCEVCGKAFTTNHAMVTHYRIHTGEKPYKCDFPGCGKQFRNIDQLKSHKCTHSTTYGYICDFCGKGFKVRRELSHHRLYHIIEYRWPCEYCDEKFRMLKYYKNHIVKMHPEKAKEIESKTKIVFYRCTMCPKMFAKKEHCAEHENVHRGHKPWRCHYCAKGFCSKGNMRQHERSHKGNEVKKCRVCSRAYSDTEMLKKHLKEKHGITPLSEDIVDSKKSVAMKEQNTQTVLDFSDCEEEALDCTSQNSYAEQSLINVSQNSYEKEGDLDETDQNTHEVEGLDNASESRVVLHEASVPQNSGLPQFEIHLEDAGSQGIIKEFELK